MIRKRLLYFLLWYGIVMLLITAAGEAVPGSLSAVRLPSLIDLVPSGLRQILIPEAAARKKAATPLVYFHAGKGSRLLSRFFTKLGELEAGRRQTVRIMHFGDSLIWADNFSSPLRRRFQKDFGDGGRGIVPAAHLPYSLLDDHVNRTAPGHFRVHRLTHRFVGVGGVRIQPDENRALGFSGESCAPLFSGATVRLEAPAGSAGWSEVGLFLRMDESSSGGTPVTVRVKLDGREEVRSVVMAPGETRRISCSAGGARSLELDFPESGALPYVDGISLETGRGIVYSTFVRMGTHLSWLGAVPEMHFLQGMRGAAPDLVIFQYGINEAASLDGVSFFKKEDLRAQMVRFLSRFRRTLPETDILIIGPPERLSAEDGLMPMEETMRVIAVQRQVAASMGAAFFDTYEFLGGPGQMMDMVRRGLAINDFTHLTRRGGEEIAGRVYRVMYREYARFSGRGGQVGYEGAALTSASRRVPILFNSAAYIYFFIAVLCASFFLMKRHTARTAVLLGASAYFYFTWETWPMLLLSGTVTVDYLAGRLICRARARGGRGTPWLALSVLYNLGVLVFFKYSAAVTGGLRWLSGGAVPVLHLLMPAGISFYAFRSLSCTIDLWRGRTLPETNPLRYGIFVSFFPQMLAGPISRARDFSGAALRRFRQIDRWYPRLATHYVSAALLLILTGLLKKAGADWLGANIVDRVYGNPAMFSSVEALAAIMGYGVQIYADFSGYTDIALGCASLLGFRLPANFNRPYLSVSVSEFWRRWHITLGSWFRDYVYIGLGGNRRRVYLNLLLTMLLCGLWHGAGLNFALWGLYHGLFLVLERKTRLHRTEGIGTAARLVRTAITLAVVLFGWIIFRVDSWDTFGGIMSAIASCTTHTPNLDPVVTGVILGFYLIHFTPPAWKQVAGRLWRRLPLPVQALAASAVTVGLYKIAAAGARPFIYFRF